MHAKTYKNQKRYKLDKNTKSTKKRAHQSVTQKGCPNYIKIQINT